MPQLKIVIRLVSIKSKLFRDVTSKIHSVSTLFILMYVFRSEFMHNLLSSSLILYLSCQGLLIMDVKVRDKYVRAGFRF